MRRTLVSVAVAVLLIGGGRAWAEIYAAESLQRYFRIEWQVTQSARGPVIEGYVNNKTDMRASRMLLEIERLDGAGQVVGRSSVWVLGDVPPGGRAYFEIPMSVDGQTYGVTVHAFEFGSREGV